MSGSDERRFHLFYFRSEMLVDFTKGVFELYYLKSTWKRQSHRHQEKGWCHLKRKEKTLEKSTPSLCQHWWLSSGLFVSLPLFLMSVLILKLRRRRLLCLRGIIHHHTEVQEECKNTLELMCCATPFNARPYICPIKTYNVYFLSYLFLSSTSWHPRWLQDSKVLSYTSFGSFRVLFIFLLICQG